MHKDLDEIQEMRGLEKILATSIIYKHFFERYPSDSIPKEVLVMNCDKFIDYISEEIGLLGEQVFDFVKLEH